jgi:uncharacterized membrane protein YjjP (DUF1212 family)
MRRIRRGGGAKATAGPSIASSRPRPATGCFRAGGCRTLAAVTAQQFVLGIGRALHALGSPSYRIEDAMDACCRALGLEGSFFSTPTAIFASLGDRGGPQTTTLLRVQPGDIDLGRLAALYAIRDAVLRGEHTPAEGLARIEATLAARSGHGPLGDALAHGLGAAGAGVLFGGGALEVAFAAAAGLLVGMLAFAARLRPGLGDAQATLACALVAFLVHLAAAKGVPVDPTVSTVAAIVVLLPGLSFTTALAELAMRHLASGSARLLGALAVLLTMAIGVGIGDRAAAILFGPAPPIAADPLPLPWLPPALLATWGAYVILLRATARQAGWVMLAIVLGFGCAKWAGGAFGREVGAFVAAAGVAMAANLFARLRRRPAAIVRTPGLLVLVPGSLGFRGMTTAFADSSASVPFLLQKLLVGGAIVAGLLIAGALLPPPLDVEPDSRLLRR